MDLKCALFVAKMGLHSVNTILVHVNVTVRFQQALAKATNVDEKTRLHVRMFHQKTLIKSRYLHKRLDMLATDKSSLV